MSQTRDSQPAFAADGSPDAARSRDFARLLEGFGGDPRVAAAIVADVAGRYAEAHRFYHNLSHVGALLAHVDAHRGRLADERGVRLAVWFHDAVYDPQSPRNEEASAELAAENLRAAGAAPETIEKVSRMILATARHDAENLDDDGKLFLDMDLSVLGAPDDVYRRYAAAIRAEYAFVPEDVYRRERARILRRFLDRERLYFSPVFRAALETRARANVANEINALS